MIAGWVLLGVAGGAGGWGPGHRLVVPFERPLVLGLAWLALTSVPAAVLGALAWAVGVPLLRPPAGPLLASIPAILTLAALRQPWLPPPWPRLRPPAGLAGVLAGVASVLLLTGVGITLGHPPTGYDALSYHAPLAVYFWRDGDLAAQLLRTPWAWALAHPGTAELWFGLLRLFAAGGGGELGPPPLPPPRAR